MAQSSKEEEEECELEEENSYYSSEAMGKTTVRRAPQSHHASSLSSLRFRDCRCPICMDVLLEPVTLPCKHSFCLACFEQASQAVSLTCSMCRKRFATWARQASRRGSLVNVPLWRAVQKLMPIRCRRRIEERDNINATNGNAGATGAALSNNNNLEGDPSDTQEEEEFEETSYTPKHICLPGEIRQEYQEQVSQFEVLRLAFEDEECQQSDHLIRKLHEEDQKEQQARDLERKRVVDQDEILANIIDMEMKLTPMKKVDKGRPETRSKRRIAKFGCDADFERPKSPRACQSKTPSFTLEDKNGNNLQISQGNQNASATYRSISASVSMLSDFTDTSQEKLAGAGSVPPRSDSTCSGDSISLELNHFKPIVSCPRTPPKRLPDGRIVSPHLVRATPWHPSLQKPAAHWHAHNSPAMEEERENGYQSESLTLPRRARKALTDSDETWFPPSGMAVPECWQQLQAERESCRVIVCEVAAAPSQSSLCSLDSRFESNETTISSNHPIVPDIQPERLAKVVPERKQKGKGKQLHQGGSDVIHSTDGTKITTDDKDECQDGEMQVQSQTAGFDGGAFTWVGNRRKRVLGPNGVEQQEHKPQNSRWLVPFPHIAASSSSPKTTSVELSENTCNKKTRMEESDRLFALKLQRTISQQLRLIDRRQGSEDGYLLRPRGGDDAEAFKRVRAWWK
uniref:E3 ubiquitin-protein ligase RNF169-like isoform X1 n=1 Tax=Myxine glutinosa TaxID=7769 RepID=UPI0035901B5C